MQPSRDAAEPPDDDDAGSAMDASTAACGHGDCDLLDPTTCESGQGCLWLLDEADEPRSQCVAAGEGADGTSCRSGLDCGPGLDCTAIGDGGTCRRYCCQLNRTPGCPAGQFCRVALVNGEERGAEVFLCDGCDGCDPTVAGSCASGRGCYPLPGTDACLACLPAGSGEVGMTCSNAMDCAPGLGCMRTGADPQSLCRAFCTVGASEACDSGSCTAVRGGALPEGLGICL